MKVIDLLNKIANEELSFEQEFKYKGVTTNIDMFSNEYSLNEEVLNFEIELIEKTEEDKEIEHIKLKYWSDEEYTPEQRINVCMTVIDELVKAVNELKKGK